MISSTHTLYSFTIDPSPASPTTPLFRIQAADQPSLSFSNSSPLEAWMQVQLPIFVRSGPEWWNPRASAGDEAFGLRLPEVVRRIEEMKKALEGGGEEKGERMEGKKVKEEEREEQRLERREQEGSETGSAKGGKYERDDEAFELRGGKKRKAASEEPKKKAKIRF